MSKDPAFLFYPGDYLRDTQTLSEKTQVAYDRIMCEHMRNICISQQQLKFFTKRLSEDEIDELMFVLTQIDGGFQIDWVAESITKRKAYSESRRKNRASKPNKDMSDICDTYDSHMENENEDENKDVIKTIIERVKEFEIEIINLNHQHKILSDSEIRKFVNYWTEHGGRAKKFRQEKQTTWNSKIRLERWHLNLQKYDNTNQRNNEQVEPEVPNYSKTVEQVEREQKELFRRQRGET
jgi:hypothetical protein